MSLLTELLEEWAVFAKDCLTDVKDWIVDKVTDIKDWCLDKWDALTSSKMVQWLTLKMRQGGEWIKEVVEEVVKWGKNHQYWLIVGIILLVLGAVTGVGFAAYGVALALAILYGLIAAGLGALATSIVTHVLMNRVAESEEITNTSQQNYKKVQQENVQTNEQLESIKNAKKKTDEDYTIVLKQMAMMIENMPPEQAEKARKLCEQAGVAVPVQSSTQTVPATASSAGLFSATAPVMTTQLVAANEEDSDEEEGEIKIDFGSPGN